MWPSPRAVPAQHRVPPGSGGDLAACQIPWRGDKTFLALYLPPLCSSGVFFFWRMYDMGLSGGMTGVLPSL